MSDPSDLIGALRRFFAEAKDLADRVTGGDVAELIDIGCGLLEEHGFDPRAHQDAAVRAAYAYLEYKFADEDWRCVKECVAVFESADPGHVRLVLARTDRRTENMNRFLRLLQAEAKTSDWVDPTDPGSDSDEGLRRALSLLAFLHLLVEQPLTHYLTLLADVSKVPKGKRKNLDKLVRSTAPASLQDDLAAIRRLRNAAAHLDIDILDWPPAITIKGEKWDLSKLNDQIKALFKVLNMLSLATAVGSGSAQRADDDSVGEPPITAADNLSLIEYGLRLWLEWTEVKATLKDGTVHVEAHAAGPINFPDLMRASGCGNLRDDVIHMVCIVSHDIEGHASPVRVDIPVRPRRDLSEDEILALRPQFKINDEPAWADDGERLLADPRFRGLRKADEPDT